MKSSQLSRRQSAKERKTLTSLSGQGPAQERSHLGGNLLAISMSHVKTTKTTDATSEMRVFLKEAVTIGTPGVATESLREATAEIDATEAVTTTTTEGGIIAEMTTVGRETTAIADTNQAIVMIPVAAQTTQTIDEVAIIDNLRGPPHLELTNRARKTRKWAA